MAETDDTGWLKLHRSSLDSRVFTDDWLWRLWCWCLMRALWKRGWQLGCELHPGQFVTGREAAAERLGVSGSKWYRGMQKLQEFGQIELRANSRFTVVTICNWQVYQQEDPPQRTASEQPPNNKRTTSGQPANTLEEGKKVIKKEYALLGAFSKNEQFAEAWAKWRRHRSQKQKPLTEVEQDVQLMEVSRCTTDVEDATRLVEYSCSRGALNLITSGDHRREASPTTGPGQRTIGEAQVLRD